MGICIYLEVTSCSLFDSNETNSMAVFKAKHEMRKPGKSCHTDHNSFKNDCLNNP